jgi:DNA-directed RNA polymerase specialized sigma subunit
MDKKEDVQNYLDNVIFQEWLPDIHHHAKNMHRKYSERITAPDELHMAGYKGLLSAFKNWNPEKAREHNSFRTYANRCILGHMQDHATGIHSFDKEGVSDPHLERESRRLSAKQRAIETSPTAADQELPPPLPEEATKSGRQT